MNDKPEEEEMTPFRRAFVEQFMPLVFELFQNMNLEERYQESDDQTRQWLIGMWYDVYEKTCLFSWGQLEESPEGTEEK